MGGLASNSQWPLWLPLSVTTWIVMMAVYHGVGFLFELCDRHHWLAPAKVRKADRLSYERMLPRVVANQTFILLPAMVFVQWTGLAFTGPAHLSPLMFVVGLLAMSVGHDVVQYITHRGILHRPRLMRPLGHALHHSTTASRSISACYNSAPDFFLQIVLPYLVPLVVIGGGGSDWLFQFLVVGLGAIGGLYEHSGFDFVVPLRRTRFMEQRPRLNALAEVLLSSHAHAEHHRRVNVSFSDGFGSFGICDAAFATRWDKVGGKAGALDSPYRRLLHGG
jgi:sterol desaturase/sphingolipid hydroxylase (fatty acid hydroxylase superfamily)